MFIPLIFTPARTNESNDIPAPVIMVSIESICRLINIVVLAYKPCSA